MAEWCKTIDMVHDAGFSSGNIGVQLCHYHNPTTVQNKIDVEKLNDSLKTLITNNQHNNESSKKLCWQAVFVSCLQNNCISQTPVLKP